MLWANFHPYDTCDSFVTCYVDQVELCYMYVLCLAIPVLNLHIDKSQRSSNCFVICSLTEILHWSSMYACWQFVYSNVETAVKS